jgi:hypothetical protein
MNIIIDTVLQVARLAPPKVIRLSVPDSPTANGMLWITYDGMLPTRPSVAMVDTTVYSCPADTYHLIRGGRYPEEWQKLMSEAGWYFGAGYMYRWHAAPGREMPWLWGLERYQFTTGDFSGTMEDSATGDASPELAELCRRCGAWEWEINSAWRREGVFEKWHAEDPTRGPDGRRTSEWPGWAASHPLLRALAEGTGYESHYYYVRPKRYNRKTDALRRGI